MSSANSRLKLAGKPPVSALLAGSALACREVTVV